MAKASIKLTKYISEYNFDPDQRKGWVILVRATDAVSMDREIFIYHRMSGVDAYTGDMFEAVASANQYYEIAKNKPVFVNETDMIPYYRRNQLEVYARTMHELDEIWEYIQLDVGRLVSDLNSTKVLTPVTESTIDSDGNIEELTIGSATAIVELNWDPAGTWDGTTIVDPDKTISGWLPISEFENSIADPVDSVPIEAKWFYNRGADTEFAKTFKRVKQPYSSNILEVNGLEVLYGEGGTYAVTKDTVFWLENNNSAVEEIQKNPWPDDFIEGTTVSYRPTLRLIVPF